MRFIGMFDNIKDHVKGGIVTLATAAALYGGWQGYEVYKKANAVFGFLANVVAADPQNRPVTVADVLKAVVEEKLKSTAPSTPAPAK